MTRKAEQTRQRILSAAGDLFKAHGYEMTTMRDIAAQAQCSLGLAYRYFDSKERMVAVLYEQLIIEQTSLLSQLPAATIADRFHYIMQILFTQMEPYRATLGAMFGVALTPHTNTGLFGEHTGAVRKQARALYIPLVEGAKDAPYQAQSLDLATILYGAQLGLILFWLQDTSEGQTRTRDFLNFFHDVLQLLRPLLALPPIAKLMVRLVHILGPILGEA
ncbi:MAG TPA: TetR/AcrR family transcriptional regulator [Dictyobacter sp.]|nr:TetR/AcrR family transcriptional regulator [Dictyobacter sp.]